jgi:hypothetical protein
MFLAPIWCRGRTSCCIEQLHLIRTVASFRSFVSRTPESSSALRVNHALRASIRGRLPRGKFRLSRVDGNRRVFPPPRLKTLSN